MNPFLNIKKPVFMPDATYGILNSITWQDVEKLGIKHIVTNTLHNFLNIKSALGVDLSDKELFQNDNNWISWKNFTNFKQGLLTDSGGFQAYSFVKKGLGKVKDDHIEFINPKSGDKHILTPEKSIQIQLNMRSDVIVVLDDPLDPGDDVARISISVERTTRWAKICKDYFVETLKKIHEYEPSYNPIINCVIQGGGDKILRQRSFDELSNIGFDGYGFGGWPLDENGIFISDLAKYNAELVNNFNQINNTNFNNYAMGVGTPDDIVECVTYGYNMFDCVLPTRNARHGYLYVKKGEGEEKGKNFDILRITNERYKFDENPINQDSIFEELRNTSKSYLRYLFKIQDTNAFRLSTLQNLEMYGHILV